MLLWIVLILYLFATLFPVTGFRKTLSATYERQVHPYSGLDPEEWEAFKKNIRAFEAEEEDMAAAGHMLAAAIENIRNLGLGIRRADDHTIQDELEEIAGRLSVDGEYDLYTSARKKGLYFFPRHLNTTREDKPDDFNRGAAIGDHFPDPRSHGQ